MTNLPTLESIAEGADLSTLPLDALDALLGNVDAATKTAGAAKKAITVAVEARFDGEIKAAFLAQSKDTGTVHVEADGYDIEATRAKKVDWDQAQLASVCDRIAAAGDDPSEYVKTTYAVDERAYQSWPTFIRSQFEAARTVKPGAVTIKLSRAKSEAA